MSSISEYVIAQPSVGALVFSSNSVLYLTEVDDAGAADGGGKEGAGPSFNRFNRGGQFRVYDAGQNSFQKRSKVKINGLGSCIAVAME